MKFEIDYTPDAAEIRKGILKTYAAAVRTKYALLADHEIRKGSAVIERRIAEAIAEGRNLEVEMGRIFTQYGPDALEGPKNEDGETG